MKTPRIQIAALSLTAAVALLAATPAVGLADHETPIAPQPGFGLPKFGFESRNLLGVGEQVTYVRPYGLAAELGIEPGDVILRLNGMELTFHGSWDQALARALSYGGTVNLAIRDVRTGYVTFRQTQFGGSGPVTRPSQEVNYPSQPICDRTDRPIWGTPIGQPGPITPKSIGNPVGPITQKSVIQAPQGQPGPITQKSVPGLQQENPPRPNQTNGSIQQLQNFAAELFGRRS